MCIVSTSGNRSRLERSLGVIPGFAQSASEMVRTETTCLPITRVVCHETSATATASLDEREPPMGWASAARAWWRHEPIGCRGHVGAPDGATYTSLCSPLPSWMGLFKGDVTWPKA